MGPRFQVLCAALAVLPLASCKYLTVQECKEDTDCTLVQTCNTDKGRCEVTALPEQAVESGFKMELNAFPFKNFGGQDTEASMTPDLLQRLHGKQSVCAAEAGPCRLRPAAKEYMRLINVALNGGRCEGFAVLSTLMFDGSVDPTAFGAANAASLALDGNPTMKAEIAYWFATQYLADVVPASTKALSGTDAVRFLSREFAKSQHAMYRLGLARVGRDGKLTGGHAIVPVAVVPAGDGKFVIRVYDNNHPEGIRDLRVDVNAGTWEYQASTNPANAAALYQGDESNRNRLFLAETQPRVGRHPCAFCEGTAQDAQQVFCSGGVSMNATNEAGQQAGEVDGKIVTDIPDSTVVPGFSADTYDERTATQMILPGNAPLNLTLRPSGAALGAPLEVYAFSPGAFVGVSGMAMEEGQESTLGVSDDGSVTFVPSAPGAATIVSGRVMPDGHDVSVSVTLPSTGSVQSVEVQLNPMTGNPTLKVHSLGVQQVAVQVTRSDSTTEDTFSGEVPVNTDGSTTLLVDTWQGEGNTLGADVDTDGDGTPDQTVSVPDTGTDNLPPTPPTALAVVSATHDRVTLGWTQDSLNEAAFEVERDSGAGFVLHATLAPNAVSYVDSTNIQHTHAYRYRVRATNPYGASEYSNAVDAMTSACPANSQDGDGDGICAVCGDSVCDVAGAETPVNCPADCPSVCGDGMRSGTEECDSGAANSDVMPDTCRTTCLNPACGDGVTDTGETCDDGNRVDTDGCLNTCVPSTCGDGVRNPATEECDNGVANSNTTPDACRTTCLNPGCGDAVTDTGEGCDDGNLDNTDACLDSCVGSTCGDGVLNPATEQCDLGAANSNTTPDACRTTCLNPRCGDGIQDTGEACDDGNQDNTDGCLNTCVPSTCGDGVRNPATEECDNGPANSNTTPDACRTSCLNPRCGDGIQDTGEACDDGNTDNTDACLNTCVASTCGDGVRNPATEECDNGPANSNTTPDACRTSCLNPRCGDGLQDTGEACDDGNTDNTDACLNTCVASTCGDGVRNPATEECDNGPANSNTTPDACRTTCLNPRCGDAVADTGEACDDGNTDNADACLNTCVASTCGDGVRNPATEECDNGPANSNTTPDACRATCLNPRCGDGVADTGEVCDDGNTVNTDSCLNTCAASACGDGVLNPATEECDNGGANSDTTPDVCRATCLNPRCGDAVADTGEACDDGNLVDTDACKNACTLGTVGVPTPDFLWLDFTDAATVTVDGSSNVTQVNDKSGLGRHATVPAGSSPPSYHTDAATDLANLTPVGKPAVLNTASNGRLATAPVATTPSMTIFAVYRLAAGGPPMWGSIANQAHDVYWSIRQESTSGNLNFHIRNNNVGPVVPMVQDQWRLLTTMQDGTTTTLYHAGETPSTTTQAAIDPGSAPVTVLNSMAIDGQQLNGSLAELRIFGRALNPAERRAVETDLAAKHGLAPLDAVGMVSRFSSRVLASVAKNAQGNVTGWTDLAGGSGNLGPKTGTPHFMDTCIGSRPCIDFTSSILVTPPFQLNSEVTFFAVMQQRAPGQWGAIAHHGQKDADWSLEQSGFDWPNGGVMHFQSLNDNVGAELTLTQGESYILTGRIAGTTRTFSATSASAGTVSTSATGVSLGQGMKTLHVGGSADNEFSNAYIGEILYFDHALTDAQRDQVITYLRLGWGIPSFSGGLQGQWQFDNDALDSSGNGHHATLASASYSASALSGPASLSVSGGSHASVPAFELGDAFTVSGWMYLASPMPMDIQALFANAGAGLSPSGFKVFVNGWGTSDGTLNFESGNGTTGCTLSSAPGVFTPDAWQHVAVTVDRPAGAVTLYLNGAPLTPAAGCVRNDFATNNAIAIGAFSDGTYGATGLIDKVAVYGSVMSAGQVSELARACPIGSAGPGCMTRRLVGSGWSHACAITNTSAVRCWGDNGLAALGIPSQPVAINAPDLNLGASPAVELSVGNQFNCARFQDGAVRCWGNNGLYQARGAAGGAVPAGAGDAVPTPLAVGPGSVVQLATGGSFACVLRDDGKVRCWGQNDFGQCGVGVSTNPLALANTDVDLGGGAAVQLCSGSHHSCVLMANGDLRCWGYNASGQLGYGHANHIGDDETVASAGVVSVVTPAEYSAGVRAQVVSCGSYNTCAILTNGALRCWGNNIEGVLGVGTSGAATNVGDNEPASAGALASVGGPVMQVEVGDYYTCALLVNGGVKCWGWTGRNGGCLGHVAGCGGVVNAPPPAVIDVGAGLTVAELGDRSESSTVCAKLSNGGTKCWSGNGGYACGLDPINATSAISPPSATYTLPPPVCGNGVVESGEGCDDANAVTSDACSNTCQVNPYADLCWPDNSGPGQCSTVCSAAGRSWGGAWNCDAGWYTWCATACVCGCPL